MFRAVVLALGLAAGAAAAAQAQITTYVAPPRAPAPTPQMVAAADSARADSIAEVAMTNMKTWVDSAAGIAVPPSVGDSSVVASDSLPPVVVTTFENGAVAPNTASLLPTVALAGVVAFAAGALLLGSGRSGRGNRRGRPDE
jgi:hypothetical protein